jgi:hypothetical protein
MLGRKAGASVLLAATMAAAVAVGAVPAPAAQEQEPPAVQVTYLPPEFRIDPTTGSELQNDILSERGQVAGTVRRSPDGPIRAYLWERGRLTEVPTPPSDLPLSVVESVNDRGDVAGVLSSGGPEPRQRLFATIGGRPVDLGPARSRFPYVLINDRGQVLLEGDRVWQRGEVIEAPAVEGGTPFFTHINNRGLAIGELDGPEAPLAWRIGGRATRLPRPAGSDHAEAIDVNDAGVILGRTPEGGVLWSRGRVTSLQPRIHPGDMNGRGDVIGLTVTDAGGATETRTALWRRGEVVELGVPTWGTDGMKLNDTGSAVHVGEGRFVYHDGRIIDLAEAAGTRYAEALDINDRGQVVGYVYDTSWYERRFVVWTLPPSADS